ncbi:MAG TPA: 5-deoxy-glucuronate isomerase [Candidatus Dormibacteraeota bacterium]|nr:5-deoxy-glucuronate isomerase [Candidatus Dormibacteraeota bacterium]
MSRSLLAPSARTPGPDGLLVSVTPESAGWSYVGFDVYRLGAGMKLELDTAAREVCAVVLAGRADIAFGDHRWNGVGVRESVFHGTPDAFYAPPGGVLEVSAAGGLCEVAMCWAPAAKGAEPTLIRAADIKPFTRGSGRTKRTIHNILMEDREAESLLVTEVLTPGGNWSSYPPHKHDTDNPPKETYLEETYYHRTARPEGFAVQLVYTDDRSTNEALQVHDGDVVQVPRGYHPVAAGPGYDLYYLNVMAGPRRRWLVTTDADHRWQL